MLVIQNNHNLFLQLGTDELSVLLGAERLGTLDRSTKSAVDDELRQDTEGAGDTKENSVEAGFGQAIVLQENAGVSIDVRPRVLRLRWEYPLVDAHCEIWESMSYPSVLGQDTRSDLVDLADELEHGVIRKLAESKLALGNIARISLAKDGVSVTGDNTASVESGPEVVLDRLIAKVATNGLLHLLEPVKDFLVGPVEDHEG